MVDLVAVVSYPNKTGGVILWGGPEENHHSAKGCAREMFPVGSPFHVNGVLRKVGKYEHGRVDVTVRMMREFGHLREDGRYAFLLYPHKMVIDGEEVFGGRVVNFPGVEELLETAKNRDILTVTATKRDGIIPETAYWNCRDWDRNPVFWFDKDNHFYDDDDEDAPVKSVPGNIRQPAGPRVSLTSVVSDEWLGNAVVHPYLSGKGDYTGIPFIIDKRYILSTQKGNTITIPEEIMEDVGYLRQDGRYAFGLSQGWGVFRGEHAAGGKAYTEGLEDILENVENDCRLDDPYNKGGKND